MPHKRPTASYIFSADAPFHCFDVRRHDVLGSISIRALNKLGSLGYLHRERDAVDRKCSCGRTMEGANFLEEFGHFLGAKSTVNADRGTS